MRGVRGGEAERSGARKRRRRGRRRRTRRTSGGVDCRSNDESFSPSRLWPPAAFEEFDPHRGSNASRVMPSQVSLRKSSSRGSSSADGTVAHFFFQIERGVMTKSSKEKREKMRGPLNTLLLPLNTSQLAHFRAFFFAMSFVMTSLSAALPMRASSRAGEFCYSMRSANEPARGARSEKAESRIWWPSSPSPPIKSFLFLFASPSRRELATARRLSGSARARVDLVLAVPERVATSRERTTARKSSCRSTTVWQFRSAGGGGGRRRRNQKEIIRRRNRRRIGHFRASRSTQSCLLYETSRKRMRINSFDGGNLRGQLEGPAETRDQINRRRRREKKNSPPFSSLLSLLFRPPTPPP